MKPNATALSLLLFLTLFAVLLPERSTAQTYASHRSDVLTDLQVLPVLPALPYTGELCKDAMALDNYQNVYSAGYGEFPSWAPVGPLPGRHAVVRIHDRNCVHLKTLVSPEPDSVYTDVKVNSTGTILFTVGTRNVSGAARVFVERWHNPSSAPFRAAVWVFNPAGSGSLYQFYAGNLHRYSGSTELLVSFCATNSTTTFVEVFKLDTTATTITVKPASAFSIAFFNKPGTPGALGTGPQFRWGTGVYRWHPRAFMRLVSSGHFYLGGTIGGDVWVNRYRQATGLQSTTFGTTPSLAGPKLFSGAGSLLLMTAMEADSAGVYGVGLGAQDRAWLYAWNVNSAPRAGAAPVILDSGLGGAGSSSAWDVKLQTIGPFHHIYVGGHSPGMGGGGVWHLIHPGPTGPATYTLGWPFVPYSAGGGHPVNDLPVYGLAIAPPGGPGLYATGEHFILPGGGDTGQMAMRVVLPGPVQTYSTVPFPISGRRVIGHTILWHSGGGGRVFSHGSGILQTPGSYQNDGEVMAFTP